MKSIDKCKLDSFAMLYTQFKIDLVVCSLMKSPVVNMTIIEIRKRLQTVTFLGIKETEDKQLHFFLMMFGILDLHGGILFLGYEDSFTI